MCGCDLNVSLSEAGSLSAKFRFSFGPTGRHDAHPTHLMVGALYTTNALTVLLCIW
jgi:hypothetical protein